MATNERNLKETNENEWRNETKKAGRMLDNLIATTEDKPYAYILIAVEKESYGTNIGGAGERDRNVACSGFSVFFG